MEATVRWASYGPDATFSAVANWLTENSESIDDLFSSTLRITLIRFGERMSRPHPKIPEQWIDPSLRIDFLASSQGDGLSKATMKRLEPIDQAWRESFAALKGHCVIREDIHYQETLELSIWQGGAVFGVLRYPGVESRPLSGAPTSPEYEVAEQYFIWMRRGDRYVGERLEIRLWGSYLPNMLAEDRDALRAIQQAPATLVANREIVAGRDTGYVALYQMQRPPRRVELGRKTISAIYDGENDAARTALDRARG